MKRDFSKHGHRDRIDKVEKKASFPGVVKKEKNEKRRLSIYDDFLDEDPDDFDVKPNRNFRANR